MLERRQLKVLGEVRGGQAARPNPASQDLSRAWKGLQAGNLDSDGSVAWSTLRWVVPAGDAERSVIREGDVLVPLRSARVSSLVARDVPPGIIAVGHWAMITTKPDVLPEYLAWYLAHPATQRELAGRMVGSSLPFVPLSAMRELEIEVPALETQQRIVRVQTLHRQQTDLEQQLTEARSQYINAVTRAALERAAHPNH
jgi:hypothetical protein